MLSTRYFHVGWIICIVALPHNRAAAQNSEDLIILDAITVTANKREQTLESVDGAISVATGDELRERDVRTVTDLQKVFPGLVIDARGNRAYSNFTVRGISSPDYYNPSVQIYVDGVPQVASAMTQELLDVERVEFLRGPQGTLYGRNAFAGVINIVSRKPRQTQADAFATTSNRLFEVGGTATGALVPETLFLDLAVKESYNRGRITDIDRGGGPIDWWNAFNGRVALRYAPKGGPFDATAWVSHDKLRSREETYVLAQDVRRHVYHSSLLGSYSLLDRDITTTGLSWNYDFGAFKLSSTTAYQYVDLERRLFGSEYPESDKNFTQELKLNYDAGGPLKAIAGLYFSDGRFARDTQGYFGYYGDSRNKVDSRSLAIYGEATYAVTDKLDLTAGARVSRDWSSINFARPDTYSVGTGFAFDRSADFTSFQPKLSLGYQVTDTTRLYALVSKGYKPGGFNHAVSFPDDATAYKPETAWNFEVGGRSALLDGKLNLSGALYYIRSTDKQIYVGPIGLQVIRNAGEATSTGVELEASLQATDRLFLSAMGTFGRSEFSDMVDPFTGGSYNDKRVPYAPDVTANLSFRYLVAQEIIPAAVTLTGAARIVGKTYFNEANTLSQAAYATFDAGLEFALDKGPTFKLFADNLTNKTYSTNSFVYNGVTMSTLGQGRTVGISMRSSF